MVYCKILKRWTSTTEWHSLPVLAYMGCNLGRAPDFPPNRHQVGNIRLMCISVAKVLVLLNMYTRVLNRCQLQLQAQVWMLIVIIWTWFYVDFHCGYFIYLTIMKTLQGDFQFHFMLYESGILRTLNDYYSLSHLPKGLSSTLSLLKLNLFF